MGEKSKSLITQENFLIFLLKILKMEICRKKRPLLIWKMEYSSKSIIFFTFHIKYILENIPFKYHFFFFSSKLIFNRNVLRQKILYYAIKKKESYKLKV